MRQRSISSKVELIGVGLHKGVPVRMVLEPMPSDSGIVFYRSDVAVSIPVDIENIVDTTMATVIGCNGARVSTVEHLLSALHAYGIDNVRVILDNEEVPIMDGSSIGFCMLIEEAGVMHLDKPKRAIAIRKTVEIAEGDKFVRLEPSESVIFDFKINFPHEAIREQSYKFSFSCQAYKEEIARARTFGFLHDVNRLRAAGLGMGAGFNNCIVLDDSGVLNKEGLRFRDEFVRHKILDAIGDMALIGMPLIGSYISFAGSHKLNHFLTKKLLDSSDAYEVIELRDETDKESSREAEYAKADL